MWFLEQVRIRQVNKWDKIKGQQWKKLYSPDRKIQSMQVLYLKTSKSWLDKCPTPMPLPWSYQILQMACATYTGDAPWVPGSCGKGYSISGLHRSQTIGDTVFGWLLFPGHYTNSRLTQAPCLPVKKAYYLSWGSSLRGRLQVCHTSRGHRSVVRERKLRDVIFVLSLGLTTAHWYLQQSSTYPPLKSQFWQLSPRGHLQIA